MSIEAWLYPKSYGGGGFPGEIVSKWYGNGAQKSFSTSIATSGLAYFLVCSDGVASAPGVDFTLVYTTHTVPLILIRFQDEPNSGRVSAWQDHAGLIHSLLSGRN